jgi:uncharacterized membrane protein YidH (DUF202 family)
MHFSMVKVAFALSDNLDQFIFNFNKLIINPLIILLFALALMLFLYGVVEFIANQGSEEKKTKGKSHMLWGIIGITIMMGVWAILDIVLNTFNFKDVNPKEGTVNLGEYKKNYPDLKN